MSNTGPLGFESVYYITFFHFKDYYLIIAVHLPGTYCLPSTALIALNLPTYCPLTEFSNQPYEINAIVILFLQTGLLRYRDAMQPTGDVSRMPCEAGQLESVFLTLWQWPLGSYVLEPAGTLFFLMWDFHFPDDPRMWLRICQSRGHRFKPWSGRIPLSQDN